MHVYTAEKCNSLLSQQLQVHLLYCYLIVFPNGNYQYIETHMLSYRILYRNKMFPNQRKLDKNVKIFTGKLNEILAIAF